MDLFGSQHGADLCEAGGNFLWGSQLLWVFRRLRRRRLFTLSAGQSIYSSEVPPGGSKVGGDTHSFAKIFFTQFGESAVNFGNPVDLDDLREA